MGLCSIFIINKLAESNYISENALTAQLISSSYETLLKEEIEYIKENVRKNGFFPFLENYFYDFQMNLNKQKFSFKERGKDYEGVFSLFFKSKFIRE